MVRVAGPSAPCCLSRGGAACPGRARDRHCAQAVRPGSGPACQRLASAECFPFTNQNIQPVSDSRRRRCRLLFRVASLSHLGPVGPPPVGSSRRGLARLPSAPGSVRPGPWRLATTMSRTSPTSPAWRMLVAPVVSALGGSQAASRSAVSVWLTGRQSRQPSVPRFMQRAWPRRMSAACWRRRSLRKLESIAWPRRMSAAPTVCTHGGSQAFSRAKGQNPCPRCILHL